MKPNLISDEKFTLWPEQDSEGEWFEPHFSKTPCECCGDTKAGSRYEATAVGKKLRFEELSVCPECIVDFQ